jgi:Bacterial protein of unknown function (DUF885)
MPDLSKNSTRHMPRGHDVRVNGELSLLRSRRRRIATLRPAQALAYKLGQLKILELRERARKELGSQFDIKSFNDEMLNGGVYPAGSAGGPHERLDTRAQTPRQACRKRSVLDGRP